MKTERTYDVGAAKYAAKKLLKSFRKGDLNVPRLVDYLSTILVFSNDSCIPKLKYYADRVVKYLQTGEGLYNDVFDAVCEIEELISKSNEKRRVMESRYNMSRIYYRKRMDESDGQSCPSKLNVYDIVKVPTMGGLHYSIISEINEGYVTCFPMTTASSRDLALVESKSVSLSGCGDDRFNGIRISSSKTKIALQDALKSYAGSVADNPRICAKLARAISFA